MNKFFQKNNFLIIAIGAVPAALLRWQIDKIFAVNLIGCFILGFVNSLPISRRYKMILGFGFCGSLTTFSGWSLQLVQLIHQGFYKLFLFNSILITLLGVVAVGLGHFVAKKILN